MQDIKEIIKGLPEREKDCSRALVAWNSLEGRPYTRDFNLAIQAEVRDPLWLLSRQWQWGEFDGEEGGSIVFSKLSLKNSKINRIAPGLKAYLPYDSTTPLEMRIESEDFPTTLDMRIELGRQWLKIANHHLVNAGAIPNLYSQYYLAKYPIQIPSISNPLDNDELASYALKVADEDLLNLYHAAAGRKMDGISFFDAIKNGNTPNVSTGITIQVSHQSVLETAATEFLNWIERTYHLSLNASQSAWAPSHLEYKVACAGPDADDVAQKFEIIADSYNGRKLDWYSFDFKTSPTDNGDGQNQVFDEQVTSDDITIRIPTKFSFKGMPRQRWWEMEYQSIDFGGIDINTTDISKVLLQDFMNNASDWYLLPYRAAIGSLLKLEGIEVKDVFGFRTFIESANKGSDVSWKRWSFLTQESRDDNGLVDTRLLLLPTIPKHLSSKPLEQVSFIRDEGANMVWGIEKVILAGLGDGKDGHEMSLAFSRLLKELIPVVPAPILIDNEANIKYVLVTEVPEHWIPFIPNQVPGGGHRAVRLQRAAMPRTFLQGGIPVVRPRTSVLQEGLVTNAPYFIHEEEVLKAGTLISKYYQRTRWTNGKIFLSLGRDRKIGRGGGTSGLKFDQLPFKEDA